MKTGVSGVLPLLWLSSHNVMSLTCDAICDATCDVTPNARTKQINTAQDGATPALRVYDGERALRVLCFIITV